MHTQDLIQMMGRLNLDAPGAVMPDSETYAAICRAIAPRKVWPTRDEMDDILRRADERLADFWRECEIDLTLTV